MGKFFTPMDDSWRDVEYEAKVVEYLHNRVPDRVLDAHSHMSTFEIEGVPSDQVFETAVAHTERIIGAGKLKGGLTMGNPFDRYTPEEYFQDRTFSSENANKHPGYVSGLLVRPQDTPEEVEQWLRKYPRIVALKPYRNFARGRVANIHDADILDFAPEWMWELADKWGLIVVMHISHDIGMLNHPRNREQIPYLAKKYPNAIMQLAHCAMGHNPHMFKAGLSCLEGLDNVWMDMSGICDALTLIYAFRDFDRKRLMYGTDGFNYGHNMMGKCFGVSNTLSCRYTGSLLPGVDEPPYLFKGLTTMTENLLSTFAAGDVAGLTDGEYGDIFYNNAAALYYPRIRD
jgi:hypothetical protein